MAFGFLRRIYDSAGFVGDDQAYDPNLPPLPERLILGPERPDFQVFSLLPSSFALGGSASRRSWQQCSAHFRSVVVGRAVAVFLPDQIHLFPSDSARIRKDHRVLAMPKAGAWLPWMALDKNRIVLRLDDGHQYRFGTLNLVNGQVYELAGAILQDDCPWGVELLTDGKCLAWRVGSGDRAIRLNLKKRTVESLGSNALSGFQPTEVTLQDTADSEAPKVHFQKSSESGDWIDQDNELLLDRPVEVLLLRGTVGERGTVVQEVFVDRSLRVSVWEKTRPPLSEQERLDLMVETLDQGSIPASPSPSSEEPLLP